jgi:selenocysteine lyase/cysteine desulfurase
MKNPLEIIARIFIGRKSVGAVPAEKDRIAVKVGQSTIVSDVSQDLALLGGMTGSGSSKRRKEKSDNETINESDESVEQIHADITKSKPSQAANADITVSYPDFKETSILDDLRKTEYAYLDEQDHVYLDYTGAGLAARTQHRAHQDRMAENLFGNPHSDNPTSQAATELVESTRHRVLQHYNASADQYTIVFTPNASGAARLVGESYPFRRCGRLVLTFDNHNSINGLREFAKKRHASVKYVRARTHDLRVQIEDLKRALRRPLGGSGGLFAYPAQSNFSGVRHPLEWVSLAQERGYDVLLDAAAYLPTATLDLSPSSSVHPDFVIVSWYKLFGYPTGVGCLIVRNDTLSRLSRPWFSGGTIQAVSVGLPWHVMAPGESAFEDGTVNFLSIPDVAVGLDWLAGIGIDVINTRVRCLTGWFLDRLVELQHSNSSPMVLTYGPTDTTMRGGNVVFNILDVEGKVVDERLVAMESAAARISLRTGCFCNPGCGEDAFGLNLMRLRPLMWTHRNSNLDTYISLIGLPSAGAIRVSFGIASAPKDVDRVLLWLEATYRDRITNSDGLPLRERC